MEPLSMGPQEVTEERILRSFRNSLLATSLPSQGAKDSRHWLCIFPIPPDGSPTLLSKFGVSYRLGTGWKAVLSNFFSTSKALQRSVGNRGKKKEAFRTQAPGLQGSCTRMGAKMEAPCILPPPQSPVLSL